MIGQMASAIAFPGFSGLGRTVTPVFLLMHHFLYRLSARSLNRLQNARSNYVLSSVRWFQMPFEGLSFVKTLVKFGIIYATDPLLQI